MNKWFVLRTAEREIGAHLRQADAAYQLALRVINQHAGIAERRVGTAPQVAEHIGAHAVWAAMHAVNGHVE